MNMGTKVFDRLAFESKNCRKDRFLSVGLHRFGPGRLALSHWLSEARFRRHRRVVSSVFATLFHLFQNSIEARRHDGVLSGCSC